MLHHSAELPEISKEQEKKNQVWFSAVVDSEGRLGGWRSQTMPDFVHGAEDPGLDAR